MKKYKLKKWVRYTLYSLFALCLILLVCKRYNNISKGCDAAYGTTCTIYDIEQYTRSR